MTQPADLLADLGYKLFEAEHPLGAAIVHAELVAVRPDDELAWLGLGVSIGRAMGMLVTEPFHHWSSRALLRCLQCDPAPEAASACQTWLDRHAAAIDVAALAPMDVEDVPALLSFLLVDDDVLVTAVEALDPEDHMFAVMALGDQRAEHHLSVLCAAVSGRWGAPAMRAALKRIRVFGDRPEIRDAMQAAVAAGRAEEASPYLEFATHGFDPVWVAGLLGRPVGDA